MRNPKIIDLERAKKMTFRSKEMSDFWKIFDGCPSDVYQIKYLPIKAYNLFKGVDHDFKFFISIHEHDHSYWQLWITKKTKDDKPTFKLDNFYEGRLSGSSYDDIAIKKLKELIDTRGERLARDFGIAEAEDIRFTDQSKNKVLTDADLNPNDINIIRHIITKGSNPEKLSLEDAKSIIVRHAGPTNQAVRDWYKQIFDILEHTPFQNDFAVLDFSNTDKGRRNHNDPFKILINLKNPKENDGTCGWHVWCYKNKISALADDRSKMPNSWVTDEKAVLMIEAHFEMKQKFKDSRGSRLGKDFDITEKTHFMKYEQFLESKNVKLDPEVREYKLKNIKGAQYELESPEFSKEFSVEPYKKETVSKIRTVYLELLEALDDMHVLKLYTTVNKAENIDYSYGNVFSSKFTLSSIPGLAMGLPDELSKALRTSQRDFLINEFSTLTRSQKDQIKSALRDRAEILCCVIEALFHYLRSVDKDNFYAGMSQDEIVDLYEAEIEKASEKMGFKVFGPFQNTTSETEIEDNSTTAFWRIEFEGGIKFFVRATISPKDLYSEENVSKTQGLKFSLITEKDLNPEKPFDFFNIGELRTMIKDFLKKLKNDTKR